MGGNGAKIEEPGDESMTSDATVAISTTITSSASRDIAVQLGGFEAGLGVGCQAGEFEVQSFSIQQRQCYEKQQPSQMTGAKRT